MLTLSSNAMDAQNMPLRLEVNFLVVLVKYAPENVRTSFNNSSFSFLCTETTIKFVDTDYYSPSFSQYFLQTTKVALTLGYINYHKDRTFYISYNIVAEIKNVRNFRCLKFKASKIHRGHVFASY